MYPRPSFARTPAEHRYAFPGSSLSFGVRERGLLVRPGGIGGDWLPSLPVTRNEGVRGSNPPVGFSGRAHLCGPFAFLRLWVLAPMLGDLKRSSNAARCSRRSVFEVVPRRDGAVTGLGDAAARPSPLDERSRDRLLAH